MSCQLGECAKLLMNGDSSYQMLWECADERNDCRGWQSYRMRLKAHSFWLGALMSLVVCGQYRIVAFKVRTCFNLVSTSFKTLWGACMNWPCVGGSETRVGFYSASVAVVRLPATASMRWPAQCSAGPDSNQTRYAFACEEDVYGVEAKYWLAWWLGEPI